MMQDTGYSNWTVEGTDFHCLKLVHPSMTFDGWYEEEPKLTHAQECQQFKAGVHVHVDVDYDQRKDFDKPLSDYYCTTNDDNNEQLDAFRHWEQYHEMVYLLTH